MNKKDVLTVPFFCYIKDVEVKRLYTKEKVFDFKRGLHEALSIEKHVVLYLSLPA